ncbi:MAG: hypothetical protein NZ518_11585, partial [Dehalococcoidia bacterium]|nr:hypothetical protein [Dehalococcoidia bacterium]
MTIAAILDDIISHLQSPSVKRLEKLSGLDDAQRAEFASLVKDMPLPLRQALARRLADFAEDDALQNFDAVFTVLLDDPDPGIRR